VPSIGGDVSSLRDGRGERTSDVMRPSGFDQREALGFHGCRPPYLPLGSRPDVLVFQTEPLREPTEVTGPIEVHPWVVTTAVDTDFTAKLIDVYPPSAWYPQGYALNLTDSIARLRYLNNREQGEPVKAGEPVEATRSPAGPRRVRRPRRVSRLLLKRRRGPDHTQCVRGG
jgi:predicted acyl esterase